MDGPSAGCDRYPWFRTLPRYDRLESSNQSRISWGTHNADDFKRGHAEAAADHRGKVRRAN